MLFTPFKCSLFYFSVFIVFIFLHDMKGLINASIGIHLLLQLAFEEADLLLWRALEPKPVA